MGPRAEPTVFYDLIGTLVERTAEGYAARPEATAWLARAGRHGLLCNAPPGRSARDVRWILEEAGLYERLTPDLILVASNLPCPLPDRRAFAVAAALAEVAPAQCVFVSADSPLREAATAAGMRVEAPSEEAAAVLASTTDAVPQLAATTPVDQDAGPTYVLEGRIVTMTDDGEVLPDGRLVISRGRIAAVVPAGEELPSKFASARRIRTGGTIYPGFIDLHNHFVYNVLPLWVVPKRYENRTQWPRAEGYSGGVTLPVRALAETPSTARAIVRYVEAKALIGGTTTGQGMRTRVDGGPRLFRGAMRNVEETGDSRLPEAATRVPNLYPNEEGVRSFRSGLERRVAYFYHLAEGVNEAARRTFTDLADNDLVQGSLVGIHCLGLEPEDLQALAEAGAKGVWSPFSNLLLYGSTLELKHLREAGLVFAIGCDWSPTGSKNLLQELKVARWVADEQGADLTNIDLARGVTTEAARVLGWEESVGMLAPDAYADVLVLAGDDGDPYDQLIAATESDVDLVVVHGVARYGYVEFMRSVHAAPQHQLEECTIAGKKKAFYLHARGSDLNDLTFAAARETLQEAMSDLPAFRETAEREEAELASLDVAPSFTVELDNEWEPTPDELRELGAQAPSLMADWSQLVESLDLDAPDVGGDQYDYWEQIEKQPNLDQGLKDRLRSAYGR